MARPIVHYIADWLEAAWRRRYLIVLPILLMPFIGFGVGMIAPKSFTAHTTILVQDPTLMNPFMKDLAVPTALKDRIAALDALLHSRHVLGSVAEDLGLTKPDTPESARQTEISRLSSMLTLQLIGTDLIKLVATDEQPNDLAPVLESASKRLMERVLAPARSAIQGSEQFLDDQLEQHRQALEKAEAELANYRAEYATELPDVQQANVARLNQLRGTLVERKNKLAGVEAAYASQRSRLAETNPVIGRIEQEQVAATAELALLRARYTDEHSEVQAVLRKLKRLDEEHASLLAGSRSVASANVDSLWNMAANAGDPAHGGDRPLLVSQLAEMQSVDVERSSLTREIANIESEIGDLQRVIATQGEHEKRLADLSRDITVNKGVYDELLKRQQMASVTGALGRYEEGERVKVIDRPYTPTAPTSTPPIIFVVVAVVAGIALGVGMAILAEIADTTLRRAVDVEKITGFPVLGRIPAFESGPGLALPVASATELAIHA